MTSGLGVCEVDSSGCVTDGDGDYGSNERCTVEVLVSGLLSSVGAFSTEDCCDYLLIGSRGVRFNGASGPSNIAVSAGSTLTWFSDVNTEGAGWTLCLEGTYTLPDAFEHPCVALIIDPTSTHNSHGTLPSCTKCCTIDEQPPCFCRSYSLDSLGPNHRGAHHPSHHEQPYQSADHCDAHR